MKSLTILSTITLSLLLFSCSSTTKLEKSELAALKGEEVKTALNSQKFVIRIDRTSSRRGGPVFLNTSHNYLIVDGENARMNLAYIGRSNNIRRISGINMAGKVTERSLVQKKRGNMQLKLTLEQEEDAFDVNIDVSKGGECLVSVYNLHLDPISYRGDMMALK